MQRSGETILEFREGWAGQSGLSGGHFKPHRIHRKRHFKKRIFELLLKGIPGKYRDLVFLVFDAQRDPLIYYIFF